MRSAASAVRASSLQMSLIKPALQHVAFLSKFNSLLIWLMGPLTETPILLQTLAPLLLLLLLSNPVSYLYPLSQYHHPLLQTLVSFPIHVSSFSPWCWSQFEFSFFFFFFFKDKVGGEFTETAPKENVGTEVWGNCVRVLQLVKRGWKLYPSDLTLLAWMWSSSESAPQTLTALISAMHSLLLQSLDHDDPPWTENQKQQKKITHLHQMLSISAFCLWRGGCLHNTGRSLPVLNISTNRCIWISIKGQIKVQLTWMLDFEFEKKWYSCFFIWILPVAWTQSLYKNLSSTALIIV